MNGCRVLVVEDEYFLADDLRRALEASGAEVVGPIGDLPEARRQVVKDGFDVAIIDANLKDEMSWSIADELVAKGIPFAFVTGYSDSVIPSRFHHILRFEKPSNLSEIIRYIARSCTGGATSSL